LTLRTPRDLELVCRVLKLVQLLLKQELQLADSKKIEEVRIQTIKPLITFVM
jgi:hypothetical protein